MGKHVDSNAVVLSGIAASKALFAHCVNRVRHSGVQPDVANSTLRNTFVCDLGRQPSDEIPSR